MTLPEAEELPLSKIPKLLLDMLLQPLCVCDSGLPYADCCEPYVTGKAFAPTAAALMRSRYTAYSKGYVDYLITTRHPKSRQPDDRPALLQSIQMTRWVGLTILKTQKGQALDKRGTVEFVALYQAAPAQGAPILALNPSDASQSGAHLPVNQLHERSRFVKEGNQWFYVDGDILPPIRLKSPSNQAER